MATIIERMTAGRCVYTAGGRRPHPQPTDRRLGGTGCRPSSLDLISQVRSISAGETGVA